jgi:hypothetical protein
MKATHPIRLLCCAALALAAAGARADVAPPMTKEEFKAEEKQVEQQAKAERKACARLRDNARDVCELEARGREKAALAKLLARFEPSPDNDKEAKLAQADAAYAVAKERCDDAAKGKPRDTCRAQAKHAHESAVRRAKVEKVEAEREAKARAEKETRKVAAPS